MIYTLDEESKKRIEDLEGLQDHVSAIHASVQTGEDGGKRFKSQLASCRHSPLQLQVQKVDKS
jgi:hypothetical protein